MAFDIISIVFVIIIVAFFLLGLLKGLLGSLISLIKWVAVLIVSAFLAKILANLIFGAGFIQNMVTSLTDNFMAKGAPYTEIYTSSTDLLAITRVVGIPDVLGEMIIKLSQDLIVGGDNLTIAAILGKTIVFNGLVVVCYIVCVIILAIIASIILNLIKKIERASVVFKFINRLGGGIVYLGIGVLICFVAVTLISFMIPINEGFNTWFTNTMHLNDDVFTLSKFFYNNNFLLGLLHSLF